jgi:hypothetical protein
VCVVIAHFPTLSLGQKPDLQVCISTIDFTFHLRPREENQPIAFWRAIKVPRRSRELISIIDKGAIRIKFRQFWNKAQYHIP